MTQHINAAGLALIEAAEGLRLTAYRDSAGVPTIGYGHTHHVRMGQTCTTEQARSWLRDDVAAAEHAVARMVRRALTHNQFAALVSFVYNVGAVAFGTSTLLRLLNAGAPDHEVAAQLARWIHAGGQPVRGLINRRAAERALFLTPDGASDHA